MKLRTFTLSAFMIAACATEGQVVINVDALQKGPEISETHYGIFYEDINHAADGGLYAELIRNRSFEDDAMQLHNPKREHGSSTSHNISNWFTVGGATISLTQQNLLNSVQHNALDLRLSAPGDGIRNEGFWGMNAVAGQKYQLTFFAKSEQGYKGSLIAQLVSADGKVLGSATVKVKASGKWKKYSVHPTNA